MSPGRRAAVLLGCSAVLGAVAASSVARREAELERAIGRPVPVVVATRDLAAGKQITARMLGVRQVPARYAPRGRYEAPELLVGLRVTMTVAKGSDLQPALIDDGRRQGAPVAAGERVFVLTGVGAPEMIVPGAYVDVLITPESSSRPGLMVRAAEVLTARRMPAEDSDGPGRVEASLRVRAERLRELAFAVDTARVVRLVPRPAG